MKEFIGEWWIPRDNESRSNGDALLSGFRVTPMTVKQVSERCRSVFEKLPLRRVEAQTHVVPLHVFARYKRQCDEGPRQTPLAAGVHRCPCKCGGAFGGCVR